jgi:hypothetical protein
VPTKIYVDSELQAVQSRANTNLASNVNIINSNLSVRAGEENQLRANITAANVEITLRDTIVRVDNINSAIDSAITSNVNTINSNLIARMSQTVAVETAMISNVVALSLRIDQANLDLSNTNAKIDNVNTARNIALNANLALKAPLLSPYFSGIPIAPTPSTSSNSSQIATTAFVQLRSSYWAGSRKFVSTGDPTASDGNNGDFWFKYIP